MIELPAATSATIRYTIALLAAMTGVYSESEVITISSAGVTLATAVYGVWRTHQLEASKNEAEEVATSAISALKAE